METSLHDLYQYLPITAVSRTAMGVDFVAFDQA